MSYINPNRSPRALSGGCGAMGDSAPAMTPVDALVNQINRFGPAAPPAWRIVDRTFSVPVASGKIDMATALWAVIIYQRRAAEAYKQIKDAGSEAAVNRANAGFADPVAFVTSNLAEVTTTIGSFADSLGLPGPVYGGGGGGGLPSGHQMLLVAAGTALVLWLVSR
jgi:hypothetical protein